MREQEAALFDRLRGHTPGIIGYDRHLRSAVCIPLIPTGDGVDVLFEVRAAHIEHQPGDICFPGGMIEPGETPESAAVREMCEELDIRSEQVEMLGMTNLAVGTKMIIHPFSVILHDYEGTFSPDEVAETFRVPLAFFLENEPERYEIELQPEPSEGFPYDRIHGGRNYTWRKRREEILFYQYGDYTIWGLTAKIVNDFARIVAEKR